MGLRVIRGQGGSQKARGGRGGGQRRGNGESHSLMLTRSHPHTAPTHLCTRAHTRPHIHSHTHPHMLTYTHVQLHTCYTQHAYSAHTLIHLHPRAHMPTHAHNTHTRPHIHSQIHRALHLAHSFTHSQIHSILICAHTRIHILTCTHMCTLAKHSYTDTRANTCALTHPFTYTWSCTLHLHWGMSAAECEGSARMRGHLGEGPVARLQRGPQDQEKQLWESLGSWQETRTKR